MWTLGNLKLSKTANDDFFAMSRNSCSSNNLWHIMVIKTILNQISSLRCVWSGSSPPAEQLTLASVIYVLKILKLGRGNKILPFSLNVSETSMEVHHKHIDHELAPVITLPKLYTYTVYSASYKSISVPKQSTEEQERVKQFIPKKTRCRQLNI